MLVGIHSEDLANEPSEPLADLLTDGADVYGSPEGSPTIFVFVLFF